MRRQLRGVLLVALLLAITFFAAAGKTSALEKNKPGAPSTDTPGQPETGSAMDDEWHVGLLPYLWLAGMHGTTGVLGRNTSVHASPGDLLSHFNIGLMAVTDLRRNRLVFPVDMLWIRLSDDHGLPLNLAGVNSIDFRAGQFVLTPKAGYRLIDNRAFKADALVGFRYWHLGEKLTFSPTVFNGVSTSKNWVDAIGGSRFRILLSPKASVVIEGDAGGGGASPDYQIAGLLGFQIKKSVALQAGWRYLDVHYRDNSSLFLYDIASSGAVLGATFYLK